MKVQSKHYSDKLLEVRNLKVSFPTSRGVVRAVNGISYDVHRGEVMGIVGESGSGKSVSAYSIIGLLKSPAVIDRGSIRFEGRDILSMSRKQMEKFRGGEISMIFQDPMSSLDPVFSIGHQLTETLHSHKKISRSDARQQAIQMLQSVGIRDAQQVMKKYRSELSGGMCQRVMIAMALLCGPKLLIADEPTTALDVTIQDQIIRLLKDLQERNGMSMILITHNFGIVADICDSVSIMYGGTVVEQGSVNDVFYSPLHPYTKALMKAIPRVDYKEYERLIPVEGMPINALSPPGGCVFHPRCASCMQICRQKAPARKEISYGHSASCWLLEDVQESEEAVVNEK
jgi:oligopeptide transport system ATP-binding protein